MTQREPVHLELNSSKVHRILMSDGRIVQCLQCGYWTKGDESILNRVPCIEPVLDLPVEQMEILP